MLIRAIVIHDPKFLGAVGAANEGNLRGGDAGESSGEFVDDFVGKLVGEFADVGVGGSAAIDLADNGLAGSVADVEHPSKDGDFGGGFGEIAESEEIGVHGRLGPIEHLEFAGLGRSLGGIEAGAGEFENAGEGEVVADDGGEESGMRLGGVGFGGEVRDGDARFLLPDAGADAEPVALLREGRGREEEKDESEEREEFHRREHRGRWERTRGFL